MAGNLGAAFRHAVELASSLDLATSSIAEERALAEAMVEVRSHIHTRRGAVDWMGTSGEAKSRAAEIYSAIHANETDLRRLKGRLRQHFRDIVPMRMQQEDVARVVEESEDLMSSESFFEDLGVFITNHGRQTTSSPEALQLALAAGRLIGLIQVDSILAEDGNAPALVSMALQSVSDTLARTILNLQS